MLEHVAERPFVMLAEATGSDLVLAGDPDDRGQRDAIVARVTATGSDIVTRESAEAALRESNDRFRQFSDSSASVLWIRDAATLRMAFASPAYDTIYGVPGPERGGDPGFRRWVGLIEPAYRATVITNSGGSARANGWSRISGSGVRRTARRAGSTTPTSRCSTRKGTSAESLGWTWIARRPGRRPTARACWSPSSSTVRAT